MQLWFANLTFRARLVPQPCLVFILLSDVLKLIHMILTLQICLISSIDHPNVARDRLRISDRLGDCVLRLYWGSIPDSMDHFSSILIIIRFQMVYCKSLQHSNIRKNGALLPFFPPMSIKRHTYTIKCIDTSG